jgi:hypothetical protein
MLNVLGAVWIDKSVCCREAQILGLHIGQLPVSPCVNWDDVRAGVGAEGVAQWYGVCIRP